MSPSQMQDVTLARMEALEGERDLARKGRRHFMLALRARADEMREARAEVERLRAALEDIHRHYSPPAPVRGPDGPVSAEMMQRLAERDDAPLAVDKWCEWDAGHLNAELAALAATPTGAGGRVTPESLREQAEWFDDPDRPQVVMGPPSLRYYTPGYLLRRIADALEQATPTGDEA